MEHHEEIIQKLDGINSRLDRLNGSVLSLKLWRAYITGAVAVIVLLGLPILGFLALQVIAQGNQVSGLIAKNK
jgi:hypothetical protein